MMDPKAYDQKVSALFKQLLKAADAVDPDQLEADGTGEMVTFTAAGGQKVIVNTQRAVWQVWVAAGSQGIHFSWDEQAQSWRDDKGKGYELYAFVQQAVREASGAELQLRP
ncbi:MAG: iron donor protein CyaY [Deltaproteobacteria bacterium]|nr:iron donor protein CyaY [Deltaproteobacteria bacterium]